MLTTTTTDAPGGQPHRSGETISILRLGTAVLERPGLTLAPPLLLVAVLLLVMLLRPASYSSVSTFLPEGEGGGSSNYSALASQLGFNLPDQAGRSLAFYVELVESPVVMREAVLTEYPMPDDDGDARTAPLTTLLGGDHDSQESRVREAARELRDRVDVQADEETGMVRVETHAPTADLAVGINARLLELLNEFNLERRQTRARAEREFLEARVAESRRELEQAERALQDFHEANRNYERSPQLTVESQRLQRRVDLEQQVYTSLAQSYEQAGIEEVRNTPAFTIVSPPATTVTRDPRIRPFLLAFTALLGLLIGVVLAFTRASLDDVREAQPGEYADFVRAREAAWNGLRGLLTRRRSA